MRTILSVEFFSPSALEDDDEEDGHTVVATARGVFNSNGGVLSSIETGVSIIIPQGAIPEGIEQEIYFKVCRDNSILPPLDKEKGKRNHPADARVSYSASYTWRTLRRDLFSLINFKCAPLFLHSTWDLSAAQKIQNKYRLPGEVLSFPFEGHRRNCTCRISGT